MRGPMNLQEIGQFLRCLLNIPAALVLTGVALLVAWLLDCCKTSKEK